jgi:hypothetical protein
VQKAVSNHTHDKGINNVCEKIAPMVRTILLSDYTIQEIAAATFTESFIMLQNRRAVQTMIIIRKGIPEIMEHAATIKVRDITILDYINMHNL